MCSLEVRHFKSYRSGQEMTSLACIISRRPGDEGMSALVLFNSPENLT